MSAGFSYESQADEVIAEAPKLRVVGGVEDGNHWQPEDPSQKQAGNLMNTIQFENINNQYELFQHDDFNVQTCTALLRILSNRSQNHDRSTYYLADLFLNRILQLMPIIESVYPRSPLLQELFEIRHRCVRLFPDAFDPEPMILD